MLGKEVQGDFSPTYPRQPHLGGIYSPVISLKTSGFTTKYAFTSHFGTEMLGKEVQGDFSPTYPRPGHFQGWPGIKCGNIHRAVILDPCHFNSNHRAHNFPELKWHKIWQMLESPNFRLVSPTQNRPI